MNIWFSRREQDIIDKFKDKIKVIFFENWNNKGEENDKMIILARNVTGAAYVNEIQTSGFSFVIVPGNNLIFNKHIFGKKNCIFKLIDQDI